MLAIGGVGSAPVIYALVVATAAVGVVGDYFLKHAALRADGALSFEFMAGAALYALTALGWLIAMRSMPLAAIGVVYAVATLLLVALLGAVVFGERLSTREMLGVCCAIAAVGLMYQPE